jgi:LPXTG-motif cell wall-anchored protein
MQVMSKRSVRAALTVTALATVTLLSTATGALACTTDDHRGHPTQGQVDNCKQVHIPGETLGSDNFTSELSQDKKWLKITGVDEGVKVTSIVVNGGDDGHNVYNIGDNNELKISNLPWEKLRAPFNYDHTQPKVGQWFACGTKTAPTKPSTPETVPATTKPSTPTKTTKPSPTTEVPTTSKSESPTTTAAPAVVPAGNGANGGGLASTGFDNSWLIWVAALLLLAGGGILGFLKIRRKA